MVLQKVVSNGFSPAPALLPMRKSRLRLSKAVVVCLQVALIPIFESTSIIPIAKASSITSETFNWKNIPPSSNLTWVKCYAARECARLEVPLDYSDPTGEKAAVALLRIKAKASPDSKEYRGPVLFNPGGPGGSGLSFIDSFGETYQTILGGEYDIVGFDPRGVGETTPPVSIFADEIERTYWNLGAPPILNSTADALSQKFFRAKLFNELVEARSKKAAEHSSTAVVARDMLSITKAHGRDQLQYWGLSYGTVLGATYAAMFPNNIERLILDGVVDFDDYYSGLWEKALLDTDKVLQFFYDKCASAGPACPLHANSSALVQQRVESIISAIKKNPVPVVDGPDYTLLDFSALKGGLFESLYTPFSIIPLLAEALAALEEGDGRPGIVLRRMMQPLPKCDTPPVLGRFKQEPGLATQCSDAEHVANTTADILQYFENLSETSIFADAWADDTYTSCAGWRVRAKERFAGPFTANTSFPILVIGNTADPATPIAGARKAVRGFEGSVLLTINTPGHTSRAATSLCANQIVRNYFTNGKLPDEDTVCEIEDVLFGV